ncbi:MAG: hypothetical protein HC781_03095, partial [Leptolyngbyaceae cyanobacterium CSU_1_4]|nr:hypothetical protein [Leptolyngbyaceae cyanobacterium CSU_1_4]
MGSETINLETESTEENTLPQIQPYSPAIESLSENPSHPIQLQQHLEGESSPLKPFISSESSRSDANVQRLAESHSDTIDFSVANALNIPADSISVDASPNTSNIQENVPEAVSDAIAKDQNHETSQNFSHPEYGTEERSIPLPIDRPDSILMVGKELELDDLIQQRPIENIDLPSSFSELASSSHVSSGLSTPERLSASSIEQQPEHLETDSQIFGEHSP